MIKGCKYEHEFVREMNERGYFCQRTAGSGCGQFSVSDCILVKERKPYLVEIKATKENIFRINGRAKTQLQEMRNVALANPPLVPMLVVRWKSKGNDRKWKFVELAKEIPAKVEYQMVGAKGGVDIDKIIKMRTQGMQFQDIAKQLGVSDTTVRKYIVRYGKVKDDALEDD